MDAIFSPEALAEIRAYKDPLYVSRVAYEVLSLLVWVVILRFWIVPLFRWSGRMTAALDRRFPQLRVAYSEAQIGWIPYVLERADVVWEHNRGWGGVADVVKRPPSSYFPDHVYACFFQDAFGLQNLGSIGEDNVTFETDFPHSDSTWPHTKKVAEESMGHLTQAQIDKICRTNAIRMLGLADYHPRYANG